MTAGPEAAAAEGPGAGAAALANCRALTAAALHRMSQPLTVLRGTAELALIRPLDVSQLREMVLTMARETERLVALTEALRELQAPPMAAPGAGRLPLSGVGAELAPLAEAAGKRMEIAAEGEAKLPAGWAAQLLTLANLALERAQTRLVLRHERGSLAIEDDGVALDAAGWAKSLDPFAAGADIAAALRAALARRQIEAWGGIVSFGPGAPGGNLVGVRWPRASAGTAD